MKKHKILFVDDEEVIRKLCKRILEKPDNTLILASSVKTAIESIDGNKKIDLLITDVKFPAGSPKEIIYLFKQKFPKASVIIITGSPIPDEQLNSLTAFGRTTILLKPFELDEFEKEVNKALCS